MDKKIQGDDQKFGVVTFVTFSTKVHPESRIAILTMNNPDDLSDYELAGTATVEGIKNFSRIEKGYKSKIFFLRGVGVIAKREKPQNSNPV
jgi:hypothetical protein